jgi:RNA polymerase sigma-70 factor, ECF subfamily
MPIFRENPELLPRFRAGDRQALAQVYDAYVERVGRFLRNGFQLRREDGKPGGHVRVDPQDLLDLAHEVFVKAFSPSGLVGYDGVRAYEPYLLMIARNTMIDWVRRRGRGGSPANHDLESLPDAITEEVVPWEDPEVVRRVDKYLAGISGDLAVVHRYRYVQGLSQEAAAHAIGTTRHHVRTIEEQLRRGLAKALEAELTDSVANRAGGT